MDYDIAMLSPSMSAERLYNNFSAKIMSLAKERMQMTSEMVDELLDVPPVDIDLGSSFDVKI